MNKIEEEKLLFRGTRLAFAVPDAFNHENEVLKFMIVEYDGDLILIYCGNECKCKEGWVKFKKLPMQEGSIATTKPLLIEFLTEYYGDKFSPATLEILE